jgi:FAD/FMN-containing dehydrogenase
MTEAAFGPSRRTVLRALATSTALLATGCDASRDESGRAATPGSSAGTRSRSVASGTAATTGPTRADWRALARAIDGDVVRRNNADYDEVKQLFNPRFDRTSPLAVIEAVSAHDVREAIAFARRFDLTARPRAGGHSYVGASTVTDGIVIDVGRIRTTRYDAASGLATVGSGAGLYSVHAALATHGRSIPTGTCPTVGAAGLTLGGGLGVDSRAHGLTSDRLRSVKIVTADGVIRTASADRNPDLYWACRGGGGGNVGVVTSMRFATHATGRFGFFLVAFPWSSAAQVLHGWARRVKQMPRSSWMNLRLEASADGSTRVRVVGVCHAGDEGVEAHAVQREVGVDGIDVSTFQKSFMDGIAFLGGGTTSAREAFAAGSDVVATMTRTLSHALPRIVARRAAGHDSAAVILDPLTGAVRDRGPGATAFPWRRHLADIQWYVGLPLHPTARQVHAAYDWIGRAHDGIGSASVGGYVNYLEPGRPVADYYGDNLARLRRVKHRYDPTGFFHSAYTV